MRLDKFLKISRIIKRRSVAKEVGDILKVQFGNKTLEVKITELHESTKKEDAQKMYEIISENRTETLEK